MAEEYDVPLEEEEECVPGEHSSDCFDRVNGLIDGVEQCKYTEVTDCEEQYECYVDVEISGEWVSGACDELAAYFGIELEDEKPEPKYGDQFADNDCIAEEVVDCVNMVKYFVDDVEACTAYNYVDTCNEDAEVGCYLEGKISGEEVEGECEELMAKYDIKMQLLEDEFEAVNGPSNQPDFVQPAKPRKSNGRRP